ncbi:hypothetical protein HYX58_00030 [Candidatus Dependentiae bacterium]|nr:hypothetical protein [Candidatus Dependentiae bacterium]
MKRWSDVFSGTGTMVLSLLSCAVCPMCLPLYAGLLSIVGIELGNIHELFFPIMIAFAVLTLGLMAYQIYAHHGKWMPFKLAIGAAIGMSMSAFYGYEYLLYLCLALFMGSILWSKRVLVHADHGCC